MDARVVFFFKQGDAGWTEVYWRSGDANLDVVEAMTRPLFTLRGACLAAGAIAEGYRISDESVFRDAIKERSGDFNILGNAAWPAATPFMAQLLRQQAGIRYRAPKYIHGIPRDATALAYVETAVARAFYGKLNDFRAHLSNAANGWKIRSKTREADPVDGAPLVKITTVIKDPDLAGMALITPSTAGMAVGDSIRIFGPKNWPNKVGPMRGVYRILGIVGNALRIKLTIGQDDQPYAATHKYRWIRNRFFQIDNVVQEGIISHKVGRPSFQRRGRQRSRRR